MIAPIDEQVRDWLKNVAGDATISFSRPSDEAAELVLFVYLFDIERPAAVPSGRIPPMQLRLGYLVSSCGPDPIAAHELLGKVIAAASTQSQYSLEFGPPTTAAWTALNLSARASFILRATASDVRDERLAQPVRTAQVSSLPLEAITGRVIAPDGTPLAGAAVDVVALGRTATASADGRFVLEGVTNAIDLLIRARVKGREVAVTRPAHSSDDVTIVIDVGAASSQGSKT